MTRRAVFLDRDGVLNAARIVDGRPYPPDDVGEVTVLPGVESACRRLADAELALIMVTNQPDIARGTRDAATVAAINDHLRRRLRLDDVMVCPHDDADGCDCRKPRPGMILDAARRWQVNLRGSFTVGDRWRDIAAGKAAGTHTIFIDRHYDELAPPEPDLTVDELKESVAWIIETAKRSN